MIRLNTHIPKKTLWMIDYFQGKDVYIVGCGPSLIGFNFAKLSGKIIIAVNHAFLYTDPSMLVFLDSRFMAEQKNEGVEFYSLPYPVVTGPCSGLVRKNLVYSFHYADKPSFDGERFYGQPNSALFALNVALYCNAAKIFLLGVDGRFDSHGRSHFYSDYRQHNRDGKVDAYGKLREQFGRFSMYKNVFNLSEDSEITAFPRSSWREHAF